MQKRVYFIGAHSTGKTTLSGFMAKKLGWRYIPEQARFILEEKKWNLADIRADMNWAAEFQIDIWKRQREAEESSGADFISDRSFDSIAYAASTCLIARGLRNSIEFKEYLEDLRSHGSITFFLRPQPSLLRGDELIGECEWADINRIDGMIEYILETEGIPYIPLESLSMKSRVRTVEGVLHAAGVPYSG